VQFPTEPVQKAAGGDRYLVPQSVLVRAVAYLIDSLLFALLAFVVLWALDMTQLLLESGTVSWLQIALIGGQCGYFFLFEATIGRSPGKIVMQLHVIGSQGRKCGVWASFLRNLIRPLDLLFFGVIGAVSILSGFKRQRLGDRLAHTQVVRDLPLQLIPPPYVPADTSARRCPRCGALSEGKKPKCGVCGFDLDSAPPWPFGGMMRPGGPQAPGGGPAAGRQGQEASTPEDAPRRAPRPDKQPEAPRTRPSMPSLSGMRPIDAMISHRAVELLADDPDTRLFAAREILLEGERDDVKALIKALRDWDLDDLHFVVNVARTLDGWRPIMVLEALRNDEDEELAESAREGLATVRERTDREEAERKAWEEARRVKDEDEDEYDDEETYDGDEADDDEETYDVDYDDDEPEDGIDAGDGDGDVLHDEDVEADEPGMDTGDGEAGLSEAVDQDEADLDEPQGNDLDGDLTPGAADRDEDDVDDEFDDVADLDRDDDLDDLDDDDEFDAELEDPDRDSPTGRPGGRSSD